MQKYYVWTIGCQMNKADSERLESALGQMVDDIWIGGMGHRGAGFAAADHRHLGEGDAAVDRGGGNLVADQVLAIAI